MKTILLATHNKAKLDELKKGTVLLADKGIDIKSLNDLKISEEPEETGRTFEENAIIKAKFYGNLTGLPTIADDGGLMIDALNGEPGVKSRRWLGTESNDDDLINYALDRLKNIAGNNRSAALKLSLCFYDPLTKKILCEQEEIKGHIADKPSPRRIPGYPYRALLIVDKYNKYYDELTEEEHADINHRLKALKKILAKILHLS